MIVDVILERFADPDSISGASTNFIMDYFEMAQRSLQVRGYPYYGKYKKDYPVHWSSFIGMYKRAINTEFPRTLKGFKDFINYLGPVPKGMKKPTVGRSDHNKGYIKGNFKWQELSENSKEGSVRAFRSIKNTLKTPNMIKRKKLIEYLKNNPNVKATQKIADKLNYNIINLRIAINEL